LTRKTSCKNSHCFINYFQCNLKISSGGLEVLTSILEICIAVNFEVNTKCIANRCSVTSGNAIFVFAVFNKDYLFSVVISAQRSIKIWQKKWKYIGRFKYTTFISFYFHFTKIWLLTLYNAFKVNCEISTCSVKPILQFYILNNCLIYWDIFEIFNSNCVNL
jgi:hypothetical protein